MSQVYNSLQVYCRDEHVGNLRVNNALIGNYLDLPIMSSGVMPVSWNGPNIGLAGVSVNYSRIRLEIKQRSLRLSGLELHNSLAAGYIPCDVPSYANERRDLQHDERVFSWPALIVQPNDQETLFDMDAFEPV